jgi:hypothetical protein
MLRKVIKQVSRFHLDEDGDLTLSVAGVVHFTFYKDEVPVVIFGRIASRGPARKREWVRLQTPVKGGLYEEAAAKTPASDWDRGSHYAGAEWPSCAAEDRR